MPTAPPAYRISRHAVQEGLDAYSYNDSKVVSGLISELALYFLIYTESANMRFAPELLWFIYWCMSHSFVMMELWQREMPEGEEPSRDRRVELRNRFQVGGGVGGWGGLVLSSKGGLVLWLFYTHNIGNLLAHDKRSQDLIK